MQIETINYDHFSNLQKILADNRRKFLPLDLLHFCCIYLSTICNTPCMHSRYAYGMHAHWAFTIGKLEKCENWKYFCIIGAALSARIVKLCSILGFFHFIVKLIKKFFAVGAASWGRRTFKFNFNRNLSELGEQMAREAQHQIRLEQNGELQKYHFRGESFRFRSLPKLKRSYTHSTSLNCLLNLTCLICMWDKNAYF